MLYLKPQESGVLHLPEQAKVVSTPSSEVKSLDGPLGIQADAITTIRVKTGHFTINACVNTRKMADRLFVTFHGARRAKAGETKNTGPMFMRPDWDEAYKAPILAISDPICEMPWGAGLPRPSLYFGTFEHNLIPEVNALIDKVCDEIGVSRDNVILYGASSGGSAALIIGAHRTTRTGVIAVCPYLRPKKYREQMVKVVAKAAGGDLDTWNATLENEPERLNPISAIDNALASGADFRAVIAQNKQDVALINHHFPILWKHFEMDTEGGVDKTGRLMSMLYDDEGGHGQEADELVQPLLEASLAHFSAPLPDTSGSGLKDGGKPKKKVASVDTF